MQRALTIFEDIGSKRWISSVLVAMGHVLLENGQLEESREASERALLLSQEIGSNETLGPSLVLQGRIKGPRNEDFRSDFEGSLKLIEESSGTRAEALYYVASLLAPSERDLALEKLAECSEIFEKFGNQVWLGKIQELEIRISDRLTYSK